MYALTDVGQVVFFAMEWFQTSVNFGGHEQSSPRSGPLSLRASIFTSGAGKSPAAKHGSLRGGWDLDLVQTCSSHDGSKMQLVLDVS